jgi:hypothetical protein
METFTVNASFHTPPDKKPPWVVAIMPVAIMPVAIMHGRRSPARSNMEIRVLAIPPKARSSGSIKRRMPRPARQRRDLDSLDQHVGSVGRQRFGRPDRM